MLTLLAQTAAEAETDEGGNGLIEVVPGLMIWTLICFAIAFFVLRKYAFGPIQKTIDDRRERIRQAVEEADNARKEARELLEQNRAILAQARSESADILAETRKVADAQLERAKHVLVEDGALVVHVAALVLVLQAPDGLERLVEAVRVPEDGDLRVHRLPELLADLGHAPRSLRATHDLGDLRVLIVQ